MKEAELRKYATCTLCRNPIGRALVPFFWRVSIERFGIHFNRITRQDGLAAYLGGHPALAALMGPDDDLAEPIMEKRTLSVCETCCTQTTCVAALAELVKVKEGG